MKIFISGPMTGYAEYNYPAFARLCEELRAAGYEVLSPHENVATEEASWSDYMKLSITQMMECQVVVTLPGWENSEGATTEVNLAHKLGMRVQHSLHPHFMNSLNAMKVKYFPRA